MWNDSSLTGARMKKCARAIAVLVACAGQLQAQTIARDSVWDYVDSYSRGRLTVSAATGDSLGITCDATSGYWFASVRFFGAVPWSPDALSTSTSNVFGFSSSSTSSRLSVMWPGNERDEWKITFISTSGVNWIGPVTADAGAASRSANGMRAGWLSNGDGFLERLVKHGKVAITYPVADWVRSFEMVFTEEQRLALKSMHDRCSKRYEGTQRKAAQ
jgi:hypothetical protein